MGAQEFSRGKPGQGMLSNPSPAEVCLTRDRKRSREKAKKTQQRCEAKPGSVPRAWIMKEDAGGGQREMEEELECGDSSKPRCQI